MWSSSACESTSFLTSLIPDPRRNSTSAGPLPVSKTTTPLLSCSTEAFPCPTSTIVKLGADSFDIVSIRELKVFEKQVLSRFSSSVHGSKKETADLHARPQRGRQHRQGETNLLRRVPLCDHRFNDFFFSLRHDIFNR